MTRKEKITKLQAKGFVTAVHWTDQKLDRYLGLTPTEIKNPDPTYPFVVEFYSPRTDDGPWQPAMSVGPIQAYNEIAALSAAMTEINQGLWCEIPYCKVEIRREAV